MCELLVRTVDKTNDDPYLDAQLTKRGDVVVIVPDGHEWSEAERSNPHWRILKFPGVPESDLASLTAPEPETNPSKPNRMRQRRNWRLDLDDPRIEQAQSRDDVLRLRVKRPRRADPNVL